MKWTRDFSGTPNEVNDSLRTLAADIEAQDIADGTPVDIAAANRAEVEASVRLARHWLSEVEHPAGGHIEFTGDTLAPADAKCSYTTEEIAL